MSKKTCGPIVAWMWLLCVCLIVSGCERKLPTRDAVVAGGSMAPALLGQHYQATCSDCGYQFAFDTKLPADKKVVCPNCGCRDNSTENLKVQPAETAEVVPMDLTQPDSLKRGDLIAFKTPGDEKTVLVKRVVGLPGEKIRIRDGDIYVDGKLFCKPLELQKKVRVPVFDSKYSPSDDAELSSRMDEEAGNFVWDKFIKVHYARIAKRYGSDGTAPEQQRMTFRNWRCCRHNGLRDEFFPVEDYYAFNQDTNRNLNPTDELYIRLEVDCLPEGTIFLANPHSGIRYKFSLDFKSHAATISSPLGVYDCELSEEIKGSRNMVIEVSTIDHTLVVLVDGVEAFRHDVFRPESVADVAKVTFAVAFPKRDAKINRVQIWRDIYYLNEGPFFVDDAKREFVAGENEVILLGDNSPVSSDSRHWENPAINTKQIIGKVVPN